MRKKLKYLILCYFYCYWYKHPGEVCYIIYKGGFFFFLGGGYGISHRAFVTVWYPEGPWVAAAHCLVLYDDVDWTTPGSAQSLISDPSTPNYLFMTFIWFIDIKFKTKWDWFRKSSMRLLSHIFMSTDNSMIHVALYPVHIDMTKRNIFYTLSL